MPEQCFSIVVRPADLRAPGIGKYRDLPGTYEVYLDTDGLTPTEMAHRLLGAFLRCYGEEALEPFAVLMFDENDEPVGMETSVAGNDPRYASDPQKISDNTDVPQPSYRAPRRAYG